MTMSLRKTLYVRLEPDIHQRVMRYANIHDFSMNHVVVGLLEQYLLMVDPTFPMPEYLARYHQRRGRGSLHDAPKT